MVKAVGLWKALVWLLPLLARQWPKLVEARARANYVGDRERERAAATLRERYAGGYLSLDDLTRRVGRVVTARSRPDLRRALSGLSADVFESPPHFGPREFLAQSRRAVLVLVTGAYVVFTFTLLLVLAVAALVHGLEGSELLAFLLVWLVPTYLLARLWRGKRA